MRRCEARAARRYNLLRCVTGCPRRCNGVSHARPARSNGTDFAEISKAVGTRTATQVRTHVQKYLTKLVRDFKKSAK